MNVTHHVVYSTKGGCGKTAFSLFLAQCEKSLKILKCIQQGEEKYEEKTVISPFLHNIYENDFKFSENIAYLREEENKKTGEIKYYVEYCTGQEETVISADYFIDFDLLGSSLQLSTKLLDENKNKIITLQDIIAGKSKISEIKPVFISLGVDGKYKHINILPVGVHESEKEMFHVKRYNTPLLRYEEMQKQLSAIQQDIIIFQEINNKKVKSKKQEVDEEKEIEDKHEDIQDIHIVYDLPPNADSYTDAVFYELFDRVKNNKNEKIILYLVSNSEHMLKCNLDWLNYFCATHKFRECPIVIVNNDNVGSFEEEKIEFDKFIASLKYAKLNKKIVYEIKSVLYFNQNDIRVEHFSMEASEFLNVKPTKLDKEDKVEDLRKSQNDEAVLSLCSKQNAAFIKYGL